MFISGLHRNCIRHKVLLKDTWIFLNRTSRDEGDLHLGKINKLEEKGEMAWCWSGREPYGKCNFFKQMGTADCTMLKQNSSRLGLYPSGLLIPSLEWIGKMETSKRYKLYPPYINRCKFTEILRCQQYFIAL